MSPINTISSPLAGQLQHPVNIPSRQLEQLGGAGDIHQGAAASAQGFGKTLSNFVSEVDTQIKTSGEERNKVLTGETTNLHQAMIASQEAGIGFTFMVELRNKLVESYQELMRSQV
ncbi:MAG: flagellar hook-basal body complex protein FliE [Verrucomicrobiae bacterium]